MNAHFKPAVHQVAAATPKEGVGIRVGGLFRAAEDRVQLPATLQVGICKGFLLMDTRAILHDECGAGLVATLWGAAGFV